eukprot:jgi/Picre1/33603/NNA_001083.t1
MAQHQFNQYGQQGWSQPQPQQGYSQPSVFVPQNPSTMQSGGAGPSFAGVDPFLSGVAGDVLRQQGQSYLQRSQAYMQSKIGFLSGGTVSYLFAVTPEYVVQKTMMLLLPFLRKWTYSRIPDQLSGQHKYQPAKQDTNAPDLYLPVTSLWTYCLLVGFALFVKQAFKPEVIYNTVSLSVGAWIFHAMVLKTLLWAMSISDAPIMELSSYAGYSFVYGCFVVSARLAGGSAAGHAVWVYCSFAYALFLVRTLKRIIHQEPKYHYGGPAHQNYLIVGKGSMEEQQQQPECSMSNLVSQGAEARVWEVRELNMPAIRKHRFSKSYRLAELDQQLTVTRLRQEVRSLLRARKLGIKTPTLYRVDLANSNIIMEKIHGMTLKQALLQDALLDMAAKRRILKSLGSMVAKLHDGDIIHGDLTTSNVMMSGASGDNKHATLYLIDFGLSQFSALSEDKAVDLYVMERSFNSAHPIDGEELFAEFMTSYRRSSRAWCSTLNKLAEVRMRGRKRSMVG